MHIWSYARYQYQELLERLLTSGELKDADALVWDLRDGWGGADPGYLDIFNPRSPTMTLTERSGEHETVNGRWRKPVVLLINGGTRSGKEVLAYGFRKYGYGKVVGTRSAGAVLAGRAFLMSNGSLLLLAVADVSVDGERLEGRGVAPDITVAFDVRYAQGQDPRAFDLVVVKSPHCQPHMFADWCARLINVDAPGSTSANVRSLGHTRCRRPTFPLDEEVPWTPRVSVFARRNPA